MKTYCEIKLRFRLFSTLGINRSTEVQAPPALIPEKVLLVALDRKRGMDLSRRKTT
jgi:hypothetical protein